MIQGNTSAKQNVLKMIQGTTSAVEETFKLLSFVVAFNLSE
jgi:hypothetical protein